MLGFYRSLFRRPVARTAPANRRTRLAVEAMEDRAVPAVIPWAGPNGGTYERVGTTTAVVPLTTNSSQAIAFPTPVVPGAEYLAVAYGTGRIGGSLTDVADAEFIRYNPPAVPQDVSSDGTTNMGLRVNGLVSRDGRYWGTYESNHLYVQTMRATATSVSLYYNDVPGLYGDNSGTLYFDLYKEGLAATVSATPGAVVTGEPVTFQGWGVNGSGGYQLFWDFGDNTPVVSGQTVQHAYATPGTYTAIMGVRDSSGNTANRTVRVEVLPPVAVDGKVTGLVNGQNVGFESAVLASGNGARFTATASGGRAGYSYTWNFGDGSPPVYAQTVESHVFPAVPETVESRTYTVFVAADDADGRRATDSIPITVYPPLRAAAAAELPGGGYTTDATVIPGQAVTLQAWGAGGDGSYEKVTWDFGDGTTGTGNRVTHTYATSGLYTATASLEDGTALATATVRVTSADEVRVQAFDGASEGGAGGYFTVFRRGTVGPLAVNLTYGGTAVRGSDYNANAGYAPLQVTIPNGLNYAYVPILAYKDNFVEGAEAVVVTVLGGTGYIPTGNPATLTIADDPPRVTADAPSSLSDGQTGTLTFSRTGGNLGEQLGIVAVLSSTADQRHYSLSRDGMPIGIDSTGTVRLTLPAGMQSISLTLAPDFAAMSGTEALIADIVDRSSFLPGYIAGRSAATQFIKANPPAAKFEVTATPATFEDFTKQAEALGKGNDWYGNTKAWYDLNITNDPTGPDRRAYGPKAAFVRARSLSDPGQPVKVTGGSFDAVRFHVTGVDKPILAKYILQSSETTITNQKYSATGEPTVIGTPEKRYMVEGFTVDNDGDAKLIDGHSLGGFSVGSGTDSKADSVKVEVKFRVGWGAYGDVQNLGQDYRDDLYKSTTAKWDDGKLKFDGPVKTYTITYQLHSDGSWSYVDTLTKTLITGSWNTQN